MAEFKRQNLKLVDEGAASGDPNRGSGSVVAAMLRAARNRAGIDLRDVADTLKIRYVYLQAIEDGRFGDLPGTTYAIGFVRAYAEFLGLDGREVVRQFKEEGQGLARRTALVFPEPIQEGRFPGGAALLIALVVCGVAYGGWYYYQSRNHSPVDTVPPVPPSIANAVAPPKALAPTKPAVERPAGSMAGQEAGAPTAHPAAGPAPSAPMAAAPAAPVSSLPRAAEAPSATGAGATESSPTAANAATPPTPPAAASPAAPVAAASTRAAGQLANAPLAAAPANADTGSGVGAEPRSNPGQSEPIAGGVPAASRPPLPPVPPQPAANTAGADTGSAAGADVQTAAVPPPAPELRGAPNSGKGHVFGDANTGSRVVLTATEDSWVQVRDTASNVLFTRVLHAGDSYRVPNQPGLLLYTGNAGALDVTVDGKAVPALGPKGSVERNIALDPQALTAGHGAAN